MLQDKTVLLGVCACTPSYKALDLIGMLKRKGADVKTAVTENGYRQHDRQTRERHLRRLHLH